MDGDRVGFGAAGRDCGVHQVGEVDGFVGPVLVGGVQAGEEQEVGGEGLQAFGVLQGA
ncbi:hypothetical protein GCM10020000_18010 [Streptomyces olivoverticillatus]